MKKATFTNQEIEIAKREGADDAAICLMENGFNPSFCEGITSTEWIIGNAFRQGYVEESDPAANSLLDKLEGSRPLERQW